MITGENVIWSLKANEIVIKIDVRGVIEWNYREIYDKLKRRKRQKCKIKKF